MPEPAPLNVSPDVKFIDPFTGLANFDTTIVNTEIPEKEIIAKAKSIIERSLNPYTEPVDKLAHDIEQLDLNGNIKLDDGAEMSYNDAMRRCSGWKLHLNFDPDNPEVVASFMQLLDAAEDANAISDYKIGHGGGRKAGQPGKEATVYIGHRDKAQLVANFIADTMGGNGLLPPEGETLEDDLPLNGMVMGRFEVLGTHSKTYNQYGFAGFGSPSYIGMRWMAENFRRDLDPSERQQKIDAERTEAIEYTTGLFGDYFTGKQFPANLYPLRLDQPQTQE